MHLSVHFICSGEWWCLSILVIRKKKYSACTNEHTCAHIHVTQNNTVILLIRQWSPPDPFQCNHLPVILLSMSQCKPYKNFRTSKQLTFITVCRLIHSCNWYIMSWHSCYTWFAFVKKVVQIPAWDLLFRLGGIVAISSPSSHVVLVLQRTKTVSFHFCPIAHPPYHFMSHLYKHWM